MSFKTTKFAMACVVTAAVIGLCANAGMAASFYTNSAAFLADAGTAGVTLSTDDLNDVPGSGFLGTSVSRPGYTLSKNVSGGFFGTSTSDCFSGNCVNSLTGTTGVTWTFDAPVNAFGVELGNLGTGVTQLISLALDGGSPSLVLTFDLVPSGTPNSLQKSFVGVIDSATAFSSVVLTDSNFVVQITYDDVQFGGADGVIPIPAALPLLLTGLASLGLFGWRRRAA